MSMGGGDASVPAGDGGDSNKVSNTGAGAGGGVTINIRCSSGSKFSVQVSLDSTVGSFKSILAQQANIPAEQQRLIYKGRILKDEQTLESYAGAAQANTTARSNTAGDTRGAPLGLGGLGSPGLEQMLGGMPDTTSLNQMMQNPAISQMMQSLLSNPQYMNQVLGMNPQLRSMLDSNPQLREMMQNPEFIRQLTSPETVQQLMTFQQGLASQLGRQQTNQQPGQNAGGAALDNSGMEMLMNMFGGLGTGGLGVPNRSNVPPEELYATQLTQLQEMGFFDTQENIRALTASGGNVHAAVERLLGNLGQ